MKNEIYDVAIIGGGPAGLTAAIYAIRAGLKVCLFEKLNLGGQVLLTDKIENYPGFEHISGFDLASKMAEQASALGLTVFYEEVLSGNFVAEIKTITTATRTICAYSVILSMGARARELNLPNEKFFVGKGVSYCATCDGAFFKGANVVVVGGGNSAFEDALYLSKFAQKVYLVHRRDTFRAENALVKQVKSKTDKIEILINSTVSELIGTNNLQQVKIKNTLTNKETTLNASGLFIAIGRGPDVDFLGNSIDVTENNFIVKNTKCETNLAGVFAAGDVSNNNLKQIVTATGEGAIAATSARVYVAGLKNKK